MVYPPLRSTSSLSPHAQALRKSFPNDESHEENMKGVIVLLDAALAALIFLIVRRAASERAAWWPPRDWLNPAVLMISALGYIPLALADPAVARWSRPRTGGRGWPECSLPRGSDEASRTVRGARRRAGVVERGAAHAATRRLATAAASSAIAAAIIIASIVAVCTS